MSFSGAKVKFTRKPLSRCITKNIPLYVRSFLTPEEKGTVIKVDAILRKIMPVFIKKEDQILISILPKDFFFRNG